MGTSNPGAVVGRGGDGSGTAVQLVNNLTDGGTGAALTAEQGKQLAQQIAAVAVPVDSLSSTSTAAPLSAKQGKVLAEMIAALPDPPSPTSIVDSLDSNDAGSALSAKQGKALAVQAATLDAEKADVRAPVQISADTVLTRAAHANRVLLYTAGALSVDGTFADGDGLYIDNGSGSPLTISFLTATAGYKSVFSPNEEAQLKFSFGFWRSTVPDVPATPAETYYTLVTGNGSTDNRSAVAAANSLGRPIAFKGVSVIGSPLTITAPIVDTLSQIFSFDSQVTIANGGHVRPEWFGLTGAVVDKAARALPQPAGGVVQLASRAYPPSSYSYNTGSGAGTFMDRQNIVFRGAQMPTFTSDCRALTGGTIIQGTFLGFADGLELRDIGIDCGYTVCTNLFGGAAQEALILTFPDATSKTNPVEHKTLRLHNVIALAKGPTDAVHAIIAGEGYKNVSITGELIACYGVHGIVLKNGSVRAEQLTAYCNANDGVIFKSDAQPSAACVIQQVGRINTRAAGPLGHSPYAVATTGAGVLLNPQLATVDEVQIDSINSAGYPVSVGCSVPSGQTLSSVQIGKIIADAGGASGTTYGLQLSGAGTFKRLHVGSVEARSASIAVSSEYAQSGASANDSVTIGRLHAHFCGVALDVGGAARVMVDQITTEGISDAVYRIRGTAYALVGGLLAPSSATLYSTTNGGLVPAIRPDWKGRDGTTAGVPQSPFELQLSGYRVCLHGLMQPTGTSNKIAVLPRWAWPKSVFRDIVQVFDGTTISAASIAIDSADGSIYVNEVSGTVTNCSSWVSLEGINYSPL